MASIFKESDWKRFRDMIPELRERYLKDQNSRLIDLLSEHGKTPTDCFWDTMEEGKKIQKTLHNYLGRNSRSNMILNMAMMKASGMLKKEDLEPFSEELQNHLAQFHQA